MKFIATTSDKISGIAVQSGQLIFSRDDRVIYLDSDVRTSFQQIITVVNEETRQNLVNPVFGFYFVKDTKALWSYGQDKVWARITSEIKETVVFANYKDFPEQGEEKILYVDESKIYQWNTSSQSYVEMGVSTWESIA